MTARKRDDFKVGLIVGSIITGAGSLFLMGYLGVLGYAAYTDLQTNLRQCRKKASELEQKVEEKEKLPQNQTTPYFRPESYQYCTEKSTPKYVR